jgi:hypothetical protein
MSKQKELRIAKRYVREGELRSAQQSELIEELRRGGQPTIDAEILLTTFNEALSFHRRHLATITAEIVRPHGATRLSSNERM